MGFHVKASTIWGVVHPVVLFDLAQCAHLCVPAEGVFPLWASTTFVEHFGEVLPKDETQLLGLLQILEGEVVLEAEPFVLPNELHAGRGATAGEE